MNRSIKKICLVVISLFLFAPICHGMEVTPPKTNKLIEVIKKNSDTEKPNYEEVLEAIKTATIEEISERDYYGIPAFNYFRYLNHSKWNKEKLASAIKNLFHRILEFVKGNEGLKKTIIINKYKTGTRNDVQDDDKKGGNLGKKYKYLFDLKSTEPSPFKDKEEMFVMIVERWNDHNMKPNLEFINATKFEKNLQKKLDKDAIIVVNKLEYYDSIMNGVDKRFTNKLDKSDFIGIKEDLEYVIKFTDKDFLWHSNFTYRCFRKLIKNKNILNHLQTVKKIIEIIITDGICLNTIQDAINDTVHKDILNLELVEILLEAAEKSPENEVYTIDDGLHFLINKHNFTNYENKKETYKKVIELLLKSKKTIIRDENAIKETFLWVIKQKDSDLFYVWWEKSKAIFGVPKWRLKKYAEKEDHEVKLFLTNELNKIKDKKAKENLKDLKAYAVQTYLNQFDDETKKKKAQILLQRLVNTVQIDDNNQKNVKKMIAILAKHGASFFVKLDDDGFALMSAIEKGKVEWVKFIIKQYVVGDNLAFIKSGIKDALEGYKDFDNYNQDNYIKMQKALVDKKLFEEVEPPRRKPQTPDTGLSKNKILGVLAVFTVAATVIYKFKLWQKIKKTLGLEKGLPQKEIDDIVNDLLAAKERMTDENEYDEYDEYEENILENLSAKDSKIVKERLKEEYSQADLEAVLNDAIT